MSERILYERCTVNQILTSRRCRQQHYSYKTVVIMSQIIITIVLTELRAHFVIRDPFRNMKTTHFIRCGHFLITELISEYALPKVAKVDQVAAPFQKCTYTYGGKCIVRAYGTLISPEELMEEDNRN